MPPSGPVPRSSIALVVGLHHQSRAAHPDPPRNRLLSTLNQAPETDYVDMGRRVNAELAFARRMFADNGWPVIDVTRRSIWRNRRWRS